MLMVTGEAVQGPAERERRCPIEVCMAKRKIWEINWSIGNKIGGGGHGTTYCVTHKDESLTKDPFALKILKQQKDHERRKRMHREVTALETLDHKGIPRIIDSNTSQYNEETELYMVSEYIPGPTLEDAIISRPFDMDVAIDFVVQLIDIIEYCHNEGVIHRDIKPDNIILKNGNPNEPVLIDFGLSFNEELTADSFATESQQEIGNRFLWLPELRLSESSKRDRRSDITACCGVLFYVLTEVQPKTLADHEGRKPHQREQAKKILQAISPEARAVLNRIFDVGFEMHIDRRWQSVEALRQRLIEVSKISANQIDDADIITAIKQMRESMKASTDFTGRQEVYTLLNEFRQMMRQVTNEAAKELGTEFGSYYQAWPLDFSTASYKEQSGVVHHYFPDRPFTPEIKAFLTGSEFVVTAEDQYGFIEIFRAPVSGFNSWEELKDRLKEHLIRGAVEFFGKISN